MNRNTINIGESASSAQLRRLIRDRHAAWSQETFGDVGPVGPLKHLAKEALEAAAAPDDLSEWADLQFLLWDAQRRAGISDGEITAAMEEKLKVNMARQWPEPKDGEPRQHIKPAPVAIKDHQIRELVNELRDIAVEHHGTQQLRERIARTVRAAMIQGNSESVQAVTRIECDFSQDDVEKLAATIREINSKPSEPQLMVAEPVSQPYKLQSVSFYRDGIEAAAKWVDQQREAYDSEHGRFDSDTGSFEFGNDAQRDYSYTLAEIVEGIRSLHPNAGNSPAIPDRWVPMQPLAFDSHGTLRFKENQIVRKMLDFSTEHGYGLNEMALENFTPDDRMQLMQLIGYSLTGYGELSYVTDVSYYRAVEATPSQEQRNG